MFSLRKVFLSVFLVFFVFFLNTTDAKAQTSLKQTSSIQLSSHPSNVRAKIVLYSKSLLGIRYRYGGSSKNGFDCSGFTSYVYRKIGINIERTANNQAKHGKYVPRNKLQPGDLIFFDTNGGEKKYINHVGIYIGNNNFIHASSSTKSKVVKVSSLSNSFYSKAYVTGRSYMA